MKEKLLEGLPIVDAKRPIVLHITAQDCRATRKNPAKCAAARALEREYRRDVRVHLSRLYIKTEDETKWTRYAVAPELRTEIIAFDRGGTFEPGEYLLKRPPKPDRDTGTGYKHREKNRNKPRHVTSNVRIAAPVAWGEA